MTSAISQIIITHVDVKAFSGVCLSVRLFVIYKSTRTRSPNADTTPESDEKGRLPPHSPALSPRAPRAPVLLLNWYPTF